MIIYQGGDEKKKRPSGVEGTLSGPFQDIWDFADNWDQAKRRVGLEQQDRQFKARQEMEVAQQKMREREMQWKQDEIDQVRLGRQATADLSKTLIEGQRPPETREFMGPITDPQARMLESEKRKWDEFERIAADPNTTPEARRLLFSQLAQESQQKMLDAQWGAVTSRFAQLAVPSQTLRGTEVPGLNPEDPEQAELLSNLQQMIDQRADLEGVSGLIAELEAEILRDQMALEHRESVGETMTMELQNPALWVGLPPENYAEAKAALARFQRMPNADPDEVMNYFLELRKRPTRSSSGATGGTPGGGNPFAPAQMFSPYQTNTKLREKGVTLAGKGVVGGGLPPEGDIRAAMDSIDPMGTGLAERTRQAGIQAGQAEGRSVAQQDPAAAADMMGAGPAARQRGMQLTTEKLRSLEALVDKAKTWQEAAEMLGEQFNLMGYTGPDEVPEWLTDQLLRRFEKRVESTPAPDREDAAAASGYGGAQQVAQGIAAGMGSKQKQPAIEYEVPPKPKHISEISGPAAGYAPRETTTWKRLPADKQEELRAKLLKAIDKTSRYDFHGALAPVLRANGIDLGSVPKKVARELRERLKEKRAQQRKGK